MPLKESMYQNIEVSRKKPISKQEVIKLLNLARRQRGYVKFIISGTKYYIMVTFHRNGEVNIQSPIRQEPTFQRNLYWIENRGYGEGVWGEFISFWINKFANKDLR